MATEEGMGVASPVGCISTGLEQVDTGIHWRRRARVVVTYRYHDGRSSGWPLNRQNLTAHTVLLSDVTFVAVVSGQA